MEHTIEDVREALWEAYEWATKQEDYCGKSSEAYCEVVYKNYWEANNKSDFMQPCGLNVYSYALGPSRMHHFIFGLEESHPNYYTWVSPDIYKTAVRVINSWVEEEKNNLLGAEIDV